MKMDSSMIIIGRMMEEINHNSISRRSTSTRVRKRQFRRQLREKENGFVLDCLNQQKSHLKTYNSISDKFLHYFVIRVHPNFNKPLIRSPVKKSIVDQDNLTHDQFQEMLNLQKMKLKLDKSDHKETNKQVKAQRINAKTKNQPEKKKMDAVLIQEIQNSIKFRKKQDFPSSKIEEADEEQT